MEPEVALKTRGEALESIAFQFCKVATVAILAGKWVIPVAAGLCAVFYVAAYFNGKRDTRCILRWPLLIATLYGAAALATGWWLATGRSLWP